MGKLKYLYIFTLIFLCPQNPDSQTTIPDYRLVNTFHLLGNDGWDYLTADETTGRVFVSHGTQVQVINEADGSLLGTIPDTKGVHGIALAQDLNKGFISCGRDSSVTIFDLKTLDVTNKVNIGARNPDAILYDPFSHRVFTFNGGSSNVSVIDATTELVLGTFPLDGKPEFAVSDGSGTIYVNIEDKNEITAIDPLTFGVKNTWSIAPGENPTGLAIDNDNHRLFSVCANKLMVVSDARSGSVVATLPIGEHPDGAGYDPILKRAYSSNGDGTLTVVEAKDVNTFVVKENFTTQKGARTMTLDTKTHHIFLSTADFGNAPDPTPENPHPRPVIIPDSFVVLDIEPAK